MRLYDAETESFIEVEEIEVTCPREDCGEYGLAVTVPKNPAGTLCGGCSQWLDLPSI